MMHRHGDFTAPISREIHNMLDGNVFAVAEHFDVKFSGIIEAEIGKRDDDRAVVAAFETFRRLGRCNCQIVIAAGTHLQIVDVYVLV